MPLLGQRQAHQGDGGRLVLVGAFGACLRATLRGLGYDLDLASHREPIDTTRANRSGIGRHCVALAQLDHTCVGVDPTERYVEKAGQASESSDVASRCSFVVGDMRQLPALGVANFTGGFDLALSLFSSLGYFADEADDLAVLRGYNAALKSGGALVIDTQCKETVLAKPAPCFASRKGGTLVVEEREYDPLTDRLRSEWTLIRGDVVVRRASINLQ